VGVESKEPVVTAEGEGGQGRKEAVVLAHIGRNEKEKIATTTKNCCSNVAR
jgi:hypothetical protein